MNLPAIKPHGKISKYKPLDPDEVEGKILEVKHKISSDASRELQGVSEFNPNFESNLELMRNLRTLLVQCLQICEGAYRSKPTQGNSYALTNMVSMVREITDRLEESIDYDEIAAQVVEEVVQPFIEKLLLELGNLIANELDTCDLERKRKFLEKHVNSIYKKFGAKLETKLPPLHKKIVDNILKNVNGR